MVTKVANLAERSIRYLEAGSGRPMIWLHAFPLSADQWLPQLSRVPPGWRFIAPDLRGFRGAGPAFEQAGLTGVTMDDYARDVFELMTHVELRDAAIGGLSMGGYVALAMMAAAPERVTGLVLANTRATADAAEARAARDRAIALVRREGVPGLARDMAPKLLGETTRRERPDLLDAISRLIEMNSADAIEAALVALRDRPDRTALLPSIRCETVVVAGAEDELVTPAECEALARQIPGARHEVVSRAGHLTNVEGDGSVFHSFLPSGARPR